MPLRKHLYRTARHLWFLCQLGTSSTKAHLTVVQKSTILKRADASDFALEHRHAQSSGPRRRLRALVLRELPRATVLTDYAVYA